MIALSQGSGDTVRNYIACSPGGAKVQSLRFRLTKLGGTPAPKVALYSSRGPDAVNPSILKPDLLAPGHQILAAFSRERPYTSLGEYSVVTDYGLLTGTSMAAPHVAGAAALLKSVYPEWTPAAIRSALMTTAYVVDNTDEPMTPAEFRAGHIDLKRAMDPGLVYDLRTQDYVDFLCGQNFTEKQINAILRQRGWHCRAELKVEDLNYPSLTTTTIKVGDKGPGRTVKFRRVLTNVGEGKSVYRATLENVPPTMRIKVEPKRLSFHCRKETKKFSVTLDVEEDSPEKVYCFLRWTDQHGHVVSSPIVAMTVPPPQ
ncbi:unnamed protein product [Linum tenue]|uniref:Uncharacterized protein n=1 Tax=Linum tenue TaxID=586396 RepID=A0AAV0MRX7_9ROSI|nr:unnamed protein product [Linum tenue]